MTRYTLGVLEEDGGALFLLSVPAILIFTILSKYIVPDLTSGAFK